MLDDDDGERPSEGVETDGVETGGVETGGVETGGVETGGVEEDRTYPSTIGGALYIVMLAVITCGLLVVVLGPWRTGIRIFAGALVAGAGLRIALKERDAGMLAVRSKPIDAGLFVTVAAALVVLSTVIPDQPV